MPVYTLGTKSWQTMQVMTAQSEDVGAKGGRNKNEIQSAQNDVIF